MGFRHFWWHVNLCHYSWSIPCDLTFSLLMGLDADDKFFKPLFTFIPERNAYWHPYPPLHFTYHRTLDFSFSIFTNCTFSIIHHNDHPAYTKR
jgi:hypothetical protein